MACNDVKMDGDDPVVQPGDSCYPTGCTPCTEAISFPDSPTDGQRYCIPIGSDGSQKCWVFDKCIPGWRAEGPSASPTRYRGAVNVKTQKPAYENTDLEIQAGDWYIQNVDADKPFMPEWGLQLGDSVSAGDRIAYSGTVWQKLEPPNVPFADEALDGDVPDPDSRRGGIVKNATTNQVLAGTNKCDTVTPYTLQKKIDDELVDFSPTKPNSLTVIIDEGTDVSVCVNDPKLMLTVEAEAVTSSGTPALGNFTYQWVETTSGQDVNLTGETDVKLNLDPYEASPSTLVRKFKCVATFTDLFSEQTVKASAETSVSMQQALRASGQPSDLDLSTNNTGTMTFIVESVDADLNAIAPTFVWRINGIEISGAQVPANTGYEFANFSTNVLTITRVDADAGNYTINCTAVGGGCNDTGLVSSNALLRGPSGGSGPERDFPSELGAVGTYRLVRQEGVRVNGTDNPGVGNTLTFGSNTPAGFYTSPGDGTWRCMGYSFISGGKNPHVSIVLWLRIS